MLNGKLSYYRISYRQCKEDTLFKDYTERNHLTIRRAAILMCQYLKRMNCSVTHLDHEGNKICSSIQRKTICSPVASEAWIEAPHELNKHEFEQIVDKIKEGF